MNKIFVIIVTYKGDKWYDRCFSSLRRSSVPVQTIVVDNASNDGTVEFIKDNYPEIILIESKENLGFGRANNLAMRYALDHGCDFVFLLNQDTWIKEDTVERMMTIIDRNPGYGIYSPMHITADEKALYIEIEDGDTDHANELLSDCYFNCLKDIYVFKYVNAAAWMVPRKTLETIGGFDPIFFLYGEDDNYLQRIEYHGYKLGLLPTVQIIHDHHDSDYPTDITYREFRHKQTRLVYYTNILNDFSVHSSLVYLVRKMSGALLRMNIKAFKSYKKEFLFLNSHKKQIDKSRSNNCKIGETWLY